MFLESYGLREDPFGVTPNPRFLYLSQTHREALLALIHGIERGRGFLTLTAEPGMGKTTLVFQLLERLRESCNTVFLFQTQCDSRELFRYLLGSLGVDGSNQDFVTLHEKLNEILARERLAGRKFVLVIDEAQNLDESVLETVRLLSDFETAETKLMQILLVGQTQLRKKLASPDLSQLRQRIATVARLEPLNVAETVEYVHHRLRVAGYPGGTLFTSDALEKIAELSRGIPRCINNLCYNALSLGYERGLERINADVIEEVAAVLDVAADHRIEPKPSATPVKVQVGTRALAAPAPSPAPSTSIPLPVTVPLVGFAPALRASTPQHAPAIAAAQTSVQAPAPDSSAAPAAPPVVPVRVVIRPTHNPEPVAPPSPLPAPAPVIAPPVAREVAPTPAPAMTPAHSLSPARASMPSFGEWPNRPLAKPVYMDGHSQRVPQFATPKNSGGLGGKIAVTVATIIILVMLLGLSGLFPQFTIARLASAKHVQADSPSSAGTSLEQGAGDPAQSAADQAADPSLDALTVTVGPNESLKLICMRYLGRYDDEVVAQIREMNPGITDPNRILPGQEVWLPLKLAAPGFGPRATQDPSSKP